MPGRGLTVLGSCTGFVLGILLTACALAEPVVVSVGEFTEQVVLGPQVEILLAPGAPLSLGEITAGGGHPDFRPSDVGVPSLGFFPGEAWMRFRLRRDVQSGPFYLEIGYRGLETIDLYSPAPGGGFFLDRLGSDTPFAEREIASRHPVFPLHPPAGPVDTYYLRISSAGPLIAPLILWSPSTFHRHQNRELVLLGLFFGALMAMLAYHLVAVISLRDPVYGWNALAIGNIGMALLTESGLAFEYLWPRSPDWDRCALPFFLGLATATLVPFARGLLDTRVYTPRLDSMLLALVGFAGVLSGAALLSLTTDLIGHRVVLALSMVLGVTAILVALPAAYLCTRAGHPSARHLLAGFLVLATMGVVVELEISGWLEHSWRTAAFVPASVGLFLLITTIGYAERVVRIRQDKDEAQYVAGHDLLTGIPNRRSFGETLAREWSRAERNGLPLSLIMMDLDHFKAYNDSHGHLAGDACLRVAAETLDQTLHRPSDRVARYGGEEFAAVLPDTDELGVRLVAERLRSSIEELAIPSGLDSPDGAFPALTMSLGCATTVPRSGEDEAELVALADTALYRAKATGRNRVVSAPERVRKDEDAIEPGATNGATAIPEVAMREGSR